MTKRKDLPDEATKEPRIRSTAEEAERAARRQDEGDRIFTAKEARQLGNADNPLRIPGEMTSRPDEDPTDHRPEKPADDDEDS
jgi:hypothetical protein